MEDEKSREMMSKKELSVGGLLHYSARVRCAVGKITYMYICIQGGEFGDAPMLIIRRWCVTRMYHRCTYLLRAIYIVTVNFHGRIKFRVNSFLNLGITRH